MSEPEAISKGSVLGDRYRLRELIGTGGMATVWRAHDERAGEEVAVKVLSDTLAHDDAYVARFRGEAMVASEFDHPNLVAVLDHDADAPRPYLTMELIAGGTLEQALERGDAVDPAALAAQLLEAVEHMHSRGIVHRDIKPANVLLDRGGQAKLTDFGIARGPEATRLTQAGQVIGTLRYLAPEVMEGGDATARSDLYSLGKVLEDAGGRAEPAIAALIDRMTSEDPGQRPGSAAAALASLSDPTAVQAADAAGATTVALDRSRPAVVGAAGAGVGGAAGPDTVEVAITPWRAVAIGMAAVVATVLIVLALTDPGKTGRANEQGSRLAEPLVGQIDPPEPEPEPAAKPEPQPEEVPAPAQQIACASIEDSLDELKDQEDRAKDAAKESGDKEAEKAIKERFKEREEELKEREKECKEAEKEREEGDEGDEGDD